MKYYWREFLNQFDQLGLEQKINFWLIVAFLIGTVILFIVVEIT